MAEKTKTQFHSILVKCVYALYLHLGIILPNPVTTIFLIVIFGYGWKLYSIRNDAAFMFVLMSRWFINPFTQEHILYGIICLMVIFAVFVLAKLIANFVLYTCLKLIDLFIGWLNRILWRVARRFYLCCFKFELKSNDNIV